MVKLILSDFTLFGLIQSFPVTVSFLINGFILLWMWLPLKKQRKDQYSIRIVNHTLLLAATWILISGITGLFFTFAELEVAVNDSLLRGVLYGLRIAMAIMPFGILACCVPVIWFLGARRAGNSN
ncbi:MAG TPA: hypothetical protein VG737_07905 [Cyclobacteriaceae bacterium]|nr:hypothetical protein [Cyclobacteriaceae bacterium]